VGLPRGCQPVTLASFARGSPAPSCFHVANPIHLIYIVAQTSDALSVQLLTSQWLNAFPGSQLIASKIFCYASFDN
jgi:hypothetical protein